MDKNKTKHKVLRAALSLFYQKGYNATSVRDIAKKAGVNISLISYYFDSKQGLFEYAVIQYYENYIALIKQTLQETKHLSPEDQFKKLIYTIIHYKHEYEKLSCFIHRELSVDSLFMREVFTTYVAKENYLLKERFNEFIKEVNLSQINKEYLFMQFKGLLATPYMMHNEFKESLLHPSTNENFVKKYTETILYLLEQAKISP